MSVVGKDKEFIILDDVELSEYLKTIKVSKSRDQTVESTSPEPMAVESALSESVVPHIPEGITTSNVESIYEDGGNA